jgi:6-phosphofructo-2-kinase/fructose-2,6-biphosphatase 2
MHWLSLVQCGESYDNLNGKIGGDSDLSPRGELYARKLPELVRQSVRVGFINLSFLISIY